MRPGPAWTPGAQPTLHRAPPPPCVAASYGFALGRRRYPCIGARKAPGRPVSSTMSNHLTLKPVTSLRSEDDFRVTAPNVDLAGVGRRGPQLGTGLGSVRGSGGGECGGDEFSSPLGRRRQRRLDTQTQAPWPASCSGWLAGGRQRRAPVPGLLLRAKGRSRPAAPLNTLPPLPSPLLPLPSPLPPAPPQVPDLLKKDCLLFYYPDTEALARKIADVSAGNVELGEVSWK